MPILFNRGYNGAGQSFDYTDELGITYRIDLPEAEKIIEKLPVREIARIFEGKCSRRMIQFVIFPERLEVVKKRQIEKKAWEVGNHKDIHTPAMQKHRAKLKELYKNVGVSEDNRGRNY